MNFNERERERERERREREGECVLPFHIPMLTTKNETSDLNVCSVCHLYQLN